MPAATDVQSLLQWDRDSESNDECALQPAFERCMLVIIDALRYDFIAPPLNISDGNWTPNAFHHNRFQRPSHFDSSGPGHSFLAHFLSDVPTTTLQRLKGLTTGSLPTFIDAGSNFGAEAIAEDNWILQLRKTLSGNPPTAEAGFAFMGDDTWLKVYPDLFDKNWTWPFDSFNVEDLHTVDEGVKKHLFPFLASNSDVEAADWKLIIAHTLGLDHVGHRHTPSHIAMTAKLEQMDDFVGEIIAGLPDDALFILAGDHGMDAQGDHGGEGELEVGSGLWIYSKRGFGGLGSVHARHQTEYLKDLAALHQSATLEQSDAFGPKSHRTFAPLSSKTKHRSVPQIDLVPSLALVLGSTVPFGNLGSVIPELFPPTAEDPSRLHRAMKINARQIRRYLRQYCQTSNDFKMFEHELNSQWLQALLYDAKMSLAARDSEEYFEFRRRATVEYQKFNRLAMNRARLIWAQFSLLKIAAGLLSLLLSVAVSFKLIGFTNAQKLPECRPSTSSLTKACLLHAAIGSLVGIFLSFIAFIAQVSGALQTSKITWPEWLSFGVTCGVQLGLLLLRARTEEATMVSEADAVKDRFRRIESKPRPHQKAMLSVCLTTLARRWSDAAGFLPVLAHSAIFASNSFTVWEDKIVHGLLTAILLYRAWRGWTLGCHLQARAPEAASTRSSNGPSMASIWAIADRAKQRIPFMMGLSILLIRLTTSVKVCREEQAPACVEGTFHLRPLSTLLQSNGLRNSLAWIQPLLVLSTCYASSYMLPSLLLLSLRQSRSDTGLVRFWSDWVFRPSLMLGSGWWIADWIGEGLTNANGVRLLGHDDQRASSGTAAAIMWGKNLIARADFVLILIVGIPVWFFAPLCLEVQEQTGPDPATPAPAGSPPSTCLTATDRLAQQQRRVQLLGFSNVFGSSYLLFFSLLFSLCWVVSPPPGQLSMAAAFIICITLAEIGNAERDLQALSALLTEEKNGNTDDLSRMSAAFTSRTPTVVETTTLYLLGYSLFFSTGHQATFLSIQWRAAFIGVKAVVYPWSPLLIIINTFGPLVLLPAVALPLILSWNLAPVPRGPTSRAMTTMRSLLKSALSLSLAATLSALCSAVWAAHFRRHLMLFKVWAPRYMLGAAAVIGIDICLLIAVAAWFLVASKTATTLGSSFE